MASSSQSLLVISRSTGILISPFCLNKNCTLVANLVYWSILVVKWQRWIGVRACFKIWNIGYSCAYILHIYIYIIYIYMYRTTVRTWNYLDNMDKCGYDGYSSSGWWWLEHDFYFPYIGNSHPNWLSCFSEGSKPPTSNDIFNCQHVFGNVWILYGHSRLNYFSMSLSRRGGHAHRYLRHS